MTSIISRAEADKRRTELKDLSNTNEPKQLTVSKVKWKDGSSHPHGAEVILSNGKRLNCQVHNVVSDAFFWYVEADIQVKFNDYSTTVCFGNDKEAEALKIADLCIPETGRTQGTKLILNDGNHLSLIYSVRFVNDRLRVKVRIHNETTQTAKQTTSDDTEGTETN